MTGKSNSTTILNLGAGKFKPIDLDIYSPYFLINVDTMFFRSEDMENVETFYDDWTKTIDRKFYVKYDAFGFMERCRIEFDHITCYRFLEHIPFHQVLYFIYLLSTTVKVGGTCDIIVPNYDNLAKMILEESKERKFDEAKHIVLSTELLNEPSCPHASIWTPFRMHHFFELEGRFEVTDLCEAFTFDGRDIYMRFAVKRIK